MRSLLLLVGLLACAGGCQQEPRFAGVSGRPARCADVLSRPAAPAPGVEAHVACVHYDVEGDTAEALAASMKERGPRDESGTYHGYTAFDLSYGYDEIVEPASCRARGVVVSLRIVHVLPVRHSQAQLAPDLSARWGHFTDRLTVHENGHGRLDTDAAVQLSGALDALGPEASCEKLRARAHAVFISAVAELRREHHLYDLRTGHGVAQGARFP